MQIEIQGEESTGSVIVYQAVDERDGRVLTGVNIGGGPVRLGSRATAQLAAALLAGQFAPDCPPNAPGADPVSA